MITVPLFPTLAAVLLFLSFTPYALMEDSQRQFHPDAPLLALLCAPLLFLGVKKLARRMHHFIGGYALLSFGVSLTVFLLLALRVALTPGSCGEASIVCGFSAADLQVAVVMAVLHSLILMVPITPLMLLWVVTRWRGDEHP